MKILSDCKVGKDFNADCYKACNYGSTRFVAGYTYRFYRASVGLVCYLGEESAVTLNDDDFHDNFKVV